MEFDKVAYGKLFRILADHAQAMYTKGTSLCSCWMAAMIRAETEPLRLIIRNANN